MNNVECTTIHFDVGGYNPEKEWEWMRFEHQKYSLLITEPEIKLDRLVGRICRKIRVDEGTKMKLKYTAIEGYGDVPTVICDDEDVYLYIIGCKDDKFSVLHVELVEGDWQNHISEKHVREDQSSRVNVNQEDIASGRDSNGTISVHTQTENFLLLENVEDVDNEARVGDDIHISSHSEENKIVKHEWDDGIDMCIGQEFESKIAVQDLIERAVHLNCFATTTVKSTKSVYVLKCRDQECKWWLRVAKHEESGYFSVRTYRKVHTCSRVETTTSASRRKGTPRLVAKVLHDVLPGEYDTPVPKTIISLVQAQVGCRVSYSTAWRGKQQAASNVRGTPEESFVKLPSYLHMLEKVNPGTKTYLEVDENNRFKYLFIALGACIEGFSAMRQVIIVDGTHIKTRHGGVLIFAIAQDPDNHHYPIAFGVVDGEKDQSWRWFLEKLKFCVPDHPELVFVSDRHASIKKTVEEVFPLSKHGFCIFHLSQNVKSHIKTDKGAKVVKRDYVAQRFRECARAYTETEFMNLYHAFSITCPSAYRYVMGLDMPHRWARCYFPGERYNIDTTNCVESINNCFRKARYYSLLPMLDAVISKIADWFNKYRKIANEIPQGQKLVPRVNQEMHRSCQTASMLQVQELNSFHLEYCVTGRDGNRYMVDLNKKSCSCKRFDIDRYPCEHAIAATVKYTNGGGTLGLHELCSKYYLVEQWVSAYARTIYPVSSFCDWNVPSNILASRVSFRSPAEKEEDQ